MLLNCLIVPTTIPQTGPISQLLLFFDQVSLYASAEDSVAENYPKELLNHYPPHPFGNDLDKFQDLIKSIKNNRAEYFSGGLSHLSSSITADIDESAVWRLINKINPEKPGHEDTLLQARLILRLAEIFSEEVENINHSLLDIDLQTSNLLKALKGEEDIAPVLDSLQPTLKTNINSQASLTQLMKAWGHLFLQDPEKKPWIIASDQQTFEFMAEFSHKSLSDLPQKLFSLPLPESVPVQLDAPQYQEKRQKIIKLPARDLLKDFLRSAAQNGLQEPNDIVSQFSAEWHRIINSERQDSSKEVGALDFYLLPISLNSLFGKITERSIGNHEPNPYNHGLVAVYS